MPPHHNISSTWRWLLLAVVLAAASLVWLSNHDRLPSLLAENIQPQKLSRKQQVGIQQLEKQLGRTIPVGRGITVGHVEGDPGEYLPNIDGKSFKKVKFTARSGPSKVSGHTQTTAKIIYGRTGLAPGIEDVNCYTISHWMGRAAIHAQSDQPPSADGRRLFTHSWISPPNPWASDVVRRVDYLIDTQDVIMVVGVNNGADSPVPAMLASAYNTIAVGVANGDSSGGYTVFEGPGRCKPDIVAFASRTSFATPIVAALVARLLETADRMKDIPSANRSEVIKAVLLAGAEKLPGWHCKQGRPLDDHLGAGSVRFDRSYAILQTGPVPPDQQPADTGWDFRSLPATGSRSYQFESPQGFGEVSIVLVWNRRIDGRVVLDLLTDQPNWIALPRLADFDLRLMKINAPGQTAEVLAQSTSAVDNVEHLYLGGDRDFQGQFRGHFRGHFRGDFRGGLPSGRYAIEVSRKDPLQEDWDYALAWHFGKIEQDKIPASQPQPHQHE